jgi:glycosyltransferase involved in cell wall biosynthesis
VAFCLAEINRLSLEGFAIEPETKAAPVVSVILPAHNEAESIGVVVSKIRNIHPDFEIIVINDGSTDNTAEIAARAGAVVYSHPYNMGNGAAVKSGIRTASGDIFVFMDSDGQHDPEDIARLLQHFPAYDMVVGARSKGSQATAARALANKIYNRFATYVAKFPIKDLTSGFRAIKAEVARGFLYLLPNTYSYPTTLTLGLFRTGRSVKYIPISTRKREKGKSDIKLVQDGIRFFMIIVRICTLYSPFRVFLPISFSFFLAGWMYYFYTFITAHRFTNMSALLLTTSAIIFMMGLVSEQISQMRFERRSSPRAVRHQPEKGTINPGRREYD